MVSIFNLVEVSSQEGKLPTSVATACTSFSFQRWVENANSKIVQSVSPKRHKILAITKEREWRTIRCFQPIAGINCNFITCVLVNPDQQWNQAHLLTGFQAIVGNSFGLSKSESIFDRMLLIGHLIQLLLTAETGAQDVVTHLKWTTAQISVFKIWFCFSHTPFSHPDCEGKKCASLPYKIKLPIRFSKWAMHSWALPGSLYQMFSTSQYFKYMVFH